MTAPIKLFAWPTPNGQKVSILLEEVGWPYSVHRVDPGEEGALDADYTDVSPDSQVTVIVDPDGPDGVPYTVFSTGAILMYVADKAGRFWPQAHPGKYDTLTWLMYQIANVGPVLGQAHHFRMYAPERFDDTINILTGETGRLYAAMDRRLAETEYLAGDTYTIADIATFPWTRSIDRQGHAMESFPNVKRWFQAIDGRPAVARGLAALHVEPTDDPWRGRQTGRRMGMVP